MDLLEFIGRHWTILLDQDDMNDWNKHKNQETKEHNSVPKRQSTYTRNDFGVYILMLWVVISHLVNLSKGKEFNVMEKHKKYKGKFNRDKWTWYYLEAGLIFLLQTISWREPVLEGGD